MGKIVQWIHGHLPPRRRLIQLYTALLYNAHVKGFIQGEIYTGNAKLLCVPGLNCYSCPGAVGACPLGALQNAVASSDSRAPTYVLGILMLYGLLLGRTICGFLCPVGLMQELLHKIPTPKIPKSRITHLLSWLKYGMLVVLVILIPLLNSFRDYPLPAFCKYICPAGTFEGAIGLLSNPVNAEKYSMLGQLFTWKFLILLVIIGGCVFVYRAFCRFLCPLGAIYGLFARVALSGVSVEPSTCIDCGRCVAHCKMDIRLVADHECIHCGECMDVCPTQAISIKAGKITLHGADIANHHAPKQKSRMTISIACWSIALALLLGAMLFFNVEPHTDDSLSGVSEQSLELQVGHEVGMLASGFTIPMYGRENVFSFREQRGKIVVINFWATWCGPCCKELPYFDEIHRLYGDDVSVIAIHSDLVTDDVEAYLTQYDYTMPFALDATGDVIRKFGGSMMLPHTVVVNMEGVITYNAVGSMNLEQLKSVIDAANEK